MPEWLRRYFALFLFLLVLLTLNGCAGLDRYVPATAPQLTAAEEERLGNVVAERLLQMLGGPYSDEGLANDLRNLASESRHINISVADTSRQAYYVLPGRQVILTRGALAQIKDPAELSALLDSVSRLAEDPYGGRANRDVAAAINEFMEGGEYVYDPNASSIRLARFFEERGCYNGCLELSLEIPPETHGKRIPLPGTLLRLSKLNQGYTLLAKAQDDEMRGKQAEAIATYLQAATEAADQPRILASLGMAYLRSGDLKSASLHLKKSVKLQPDYYRSLMGLGYLYLQEGRVSSAKDKLAASVRLLPVAENLFLLAEAMEKSADIAGARSLYQLVVEADRYSKLGRTATSRLKEISVNNE